MVDFVGGANDIIHVGVKLLSLSEFSESNAKFRRSVNKIESATANVFVETNKIVSELTGL